VSKTSMQLLISEKLKSLSNNYVFDTIPNYGMIIMKYNAKTNTVSYEYQQGFFPVPMFRMTF
jgi:hypothetical protein